VVAVLAFTVWIKGVDVLWMNEGLPLYTAVIDSMPTANFVVV
jgi:hypothetical protein